MALESNGPSAFTGMWRLGQVLELGRCNEPTEFDSDRLGVSVSNEMLSRLLNLGGESAMRIDEVSWTFAHEHSISPLRLCATVTSHAVRDGHETFELFLAAVADDGATVVRGESVLTSHGVSQKGSDAAGAPARFAGEPWVALLADRVREDERFATATMAYDGSIGFRFGRSTLGLRVYRGKVIDQGRVVFNDATFCVGASTHGWLEFARRPRNEFISFAMADRFAVSGSTYEYLRMTSAVIVITDHVRALIRAELGEI
jgi:hypothetical protein